MTKKEALSHRRRTPVNPAGQRPEGLQAVLAVAEEISCTFIQLFPGQRDHVPLTTSMQAVKIWKVFAGPLPQIIFVLLAAAVTSSLHVLDRSRAAMKCTQCLILLPTPAGNIYSRWTAMRRPLLISRHASWPGFVAGYEE